MKRLKNLLYSLEKSKNGIVVITFDSNNDPLYLSFWGIDNKRAYYLYGAGNPENTNSIRGTRNFWDSFQFLSTQFNVQEIDFEGINSPERGRYKLSFGGEIRSYYRISKFE